MLNTARDMYRYFLSGIRKENTVIMQPDEWTEFINPIVIDWVKTKLPLNEFSQKRIDDLEAIRVRTDGQQYNMIYTSTENVFTIPDGNDYPKYLHGLSAEFVIAFQEEEEDDGGGIMTGATNTIVSESKFGKPLRSDLRKAVKENPYRQANEDNLYFEIRDGKIYVQSSKKYNYLMLEYYRYPDLIVFSEDGTDEPGSFKGSQNKEIMDLAIINYLGVVLDEEFKTKAQINSSIPQ